MMDGIKKGLFLLFIIPLVSGCAGGDEGFNSTGIGGVYNSDYENTDFKTELAVNTEDDSFSIAAEEVYNLEAMAVSNTGNPPGNTLLRWGIRRKSDNTTPDADPGAPNLLSQYGGAYIGDTSKKVVYLTFDEGYENGYTGKILDVLKSNNVKAAFFITGPYLKEQEALVRRMVEEGHTVGNHTIHHYSLPSLDDSKLQEEIMGLERVFKEKFGQDMNFLRPPKGEYSARTLKLTQDMGYCNLFWSFAYDDWDVKKTRGSEYAMNMVDKNLHNGAVLLLHAVSKDNAEGLEGIIKNISAKGYEIGDVRDLAPKQQ